MHALREVQERRRGGVLEAAHGLDPGAGGVDHAARAHAHPAAAQAADGLEPGGPAAIPNDGVDLRVVQHRGAEARGRAQIREHEVGIVGVIFAIHAGVSIDRRVEQRLLALDLARAPVAVEIGALDRAELFVGRDGGAHLEQARVRAHGHDHPAALRQVRREPEDLLAFEGRRAHERDVSHREIAQAAVDQLRGAARGS